MFERYTEKARRSIFFARYEASVFGSPQIQIEHLLLGVLREDRIFSDRVLIHEIRKLIETHLSVGPEIPTSVDLPLSPESKRALDYSAEEAEKLGHLLIDTRHQLLGILRESSFAKDLLLEYGVDENVVRAGIASATLHPKAMELEPVVAALNELRSNEPRLVRLGTVELGRLVDVAIAFEQWLTRGARDTIFEIPPPEANAELYQSLPRAPLVRLWLSIHELMVHAVCHTPDGEASRVAAAATIYTNFARKASA